jgi:hypothetical protein
MSQDELLRTVDAPPSSATEALESDHDAAAEIATTPTEEELQQEQLLDDAASPQEGVREVADFWPTDDESPDYAHLGDVSAPGSFAVEARDIETLIAANRFQPSGHNDVITLAIRGSVLQRPHEQERQSAISLIDQRPNHADFRCTLGFYFRGEGKLTLLTGSTVPCPRYMKNYLNRVNGRPHVASMPNCNMLPTGCYVFRVGAHGGGSIRPALRMTNPDNLSLDAEATVLRTEDDLSFGFGARDRYDKCMPFDNVHCSYFINFMDNYEAFFSSAGCLTVRGRKDPSHQWKTFQTQLSALGQGKRCDLILLTGREMAIAAKLRLDGALADADLVDARLGRLRVGSHGEGVRRLQEKLGFTSPTGYFGPATKLALVQQQKLESVPPDGVYAPALDARLNWGVWSPQA